MHYNRGATGLSQLHREGEKGGQAADHCQPERNLAGHWLDYARSIEQAGADALELNLMILAAEPDVTAEEVEERYLRDRRRGAGNGPPAVGGQAGAVFHGLAQLWRRG